MAAVRLKEKRRTSTSAVELCVAVTSHASIRVIGSEFKSWGRISKGVK